MNIQSIAASIENLRARLQPVQALANQLTEMQTAVREAAEIRQSLAALESQLAEVHANQRAAATAAKRYSIQRIVQSGDGHPLTSGWKVQYVENQYGVNGPEQSAGYQWLSGTTQELLSAIVADADKLPLAIRALHDEPEQAIRMYCQTKARGYVRG
jgi:hypothetical protein